MYEGWAKGSGPCTATFNDLLCFPFLINPLLIPHLEWSVGLCLRGRHSSHSIPWRTGPGDEILFGLQPHNHTGRVWLIRLLLGTFRKLGHRSIPVWKEATNYMAKQLTVTRKWSCDWMTPWQNDWMTDRMIDCLAKWLVHRMNGLKNEGLLIKWLNTLISRDWLND
jgi:hypothetical protein